ncbi:unnamed protein product [Linum trigynum]|uniref:Aspartic peptidase DDI1-type domain-containing protein n=1 Tax=Linum trigynum TaxID=586398 RepID=A0AAV2GAA6_9ROSI
MVCLVQTIPDRTTQVWSGLVHGLYSNISVWTTDRIYGLDRTAPFPTPMLQHFQLMRRKWRKFMDMLKQVNISMPFVEAVSKMPKYAKFMKDLLTNKRKLVEMSMVVLNEECFVILQNKLTEKRKDPGSFTIPCMIGSLQIGKSLADLGTSINVMPYKLYKKLGLGEPSNTRMSIQLADRSIVHPRGIAEDLIVAIGSFSYLVDFVILDINEDVDVPLILGRPFLATAKALINVNDGKLILRAGGEQITFSVSDNMKHPQIHDDLDYCDVIADFETALAITSAGTDDFLKRCNTPLGVYVIKVTQLTTQSKNRLKNRLSSNQEQSVLNTNLDKT